MKATTFFDAQKAFILKQWANGIPGFPPAVRAEHLRAIPGAARGGEGSPPRGRTEGCRRGTRMDARPMACAEMEIRPPV